MKHIIYYVSPRSFQHPYSYSLHFHNDHSTELQVLQTTHDLVTSLNYRSQCNVDFSKAFDRVPHCHLMLKLEPPTSFSTLS